MLDIEGLECPKCKRKGLVRRLHSEDDLFQCVYCGYQQNLTKPSQAGSPGVIFLALLSALFLTLAIFSI